MSQWKTFTLFFNTVLHHLLNHLSGETGTWLNDSTEHWQFVFLYGIDRGHSAH